MVGTSLILSYTWPPNFIIIEISWLWQESFNSTQERNDTDDWWNVPWSLIFILLYVRVSSTWADSWTPWHGIIYSLGDDVVFDVRRLKSSKLEDRGRETGVICNFYYIRRALQYLGIVDDVLRLVPQSYRYPRKLLEKRNDGGSGHFLALCSIKVCCASHQASCVTIPEIKRQRLLNPCELQTESPAIQWSAAGLFNDNLELFTAEWWDDILVYGAKQCIRRAKTMGDGL